MDPAGQKIDRKSIKCQYVIIEIVFFGNCPTVAN